MSIDEMDEHEQSERVREWVRKNAGSILFGIVVGLSGLVGWKYWTQHEISKAEQAQDIYRSLVEAEAKNDTATVDALKLRIAKDFGGSAYAVFNDLRQAKSASKKDDLKPVVEALTSAMQKTDSDVLRDLTAIRLARVKVAQGEHTVALDLIKNINAKAYLGLVAALRGDIYLAQGQKQQALTAYEQALGALDANSAQRTFVEMKRDDLQRVAVAVDLPSVSKPAVTAPKVAPSKNEGT
jgi:predicted negative regulator of RcsB-dependent stress response